MKVLCKFICDQCTSQLTNAQSHSPQSAIHSQESLRLTFAQSVLETQSQSHPQWKQLQWESNPLKTIAGLNLRHQLNAFNGEKPELNKGNSQQGEITTQLCTINWLSDLCNSVSAECSDQSTGLYRRPILGTQMRSMPNELHLNYE